MLLVLLGFVAASSVVIISAVSGATPLRRRHAHAADNDEVHDQVATSFVLDCSRLSVVVLPGRRTATKPSAKFP